ncbi:MAG: O-antigen ligase family protein [Pirellulales bacterium]
MPLIFLIALPVVLVWGAVYHRWRSPLAGCLAFLAVGYCLGHQFLAFDVGPVPLTLERLLLVGITGSFALHRYRGALATDRPLLKVDWLLVALVGLLLATMFIHPAMTRGANADGSPLWRWLAAYVMPLVLYGIARQTPISRQWMRSVLIVLTGLGIYLAVTAVAEVNQQWWLVFPRYIADPTIGIHFGRARGPALASQSLGLYLTICMLSAWQLRSYVGRATQLVLWASYPLLLTAIFFTYTRATWLAVAAGLLVLLCFELKGIWRTVILGGGVMAVLVIAVAFGSQLMALKRDSSAADSRNSVYQRASFAYVSWRMFLDRPLLGVGLGNFSQAKLPYLADRSVAIRLESIRSLEHHNTFLSLLTESGIVGLSLFLAVLVGWARAAWQLAHDSAAPAWSRSSGVLLLAMLVAYVFPAMFHDVTLSPPNQWIVFFLAGIVVGLRAELLPEEFRRGQSVRADVPQIGTSNSDSSFGLAGSIA